MTVDLPVTELAGVGPDLTRRLARLEVRTIGDLLHHYPRRYEDWQTTRPIHALRRGEEAVIRATVVAITAHRSPRRRLMLTTATLADDSASIPALWFGQPYLAQTLRVGQTFLFRGMPTWDRTSGGTILLGPAYERTPAILPIYPETSGVSSKRLRQLVSQALRAIPSDPDPLPPSVTAAGGLMTHAAALRTIHQPRSLTALPAARERLAFEELLSFMLRLRQVRVGLASHRSPRLAATEASLRRFTHRLPFQLTNGQRQAAWEIIRDIGRDRPMHRLLQGDVGSGKTVVAAFAAYVAARSGYQTLYMAPTEILAAQHAETFEKLLKPFGIPIGVWTGRQKTDGAVLARPNSVIIGTHALLAQSLAFPHLGLVIIDEQHRFGIDQRAFLRSRRNQDDHLPHFLSMSATPIPRTLALVLYADLDVSHIRERPPGRPTVVTKVIQPEGRPIVETLIRQEIAAGYQVYVVCPIIDATIAPTNGTLFADGERRSALAEYARIRREFPKARVGLLHGRLVGAAKTKVMDEFRRGQFDILVATAVIEVGLDVPNATVMVIESANRFGLAQLHQLRGRVGRGTHPSYCLLVVDQWSTTVAARLRAMEQADDGLELAETDLRLRGPGQAAGSEQSGWPDFRLASLFELDLVARARQAADRAIAEGWPPPAESRDGESS